MSVGVVSQDQKGVIISANPAAERLLGLSLDQLQGRTSIDPSWKSVREDGSDFPGNEHPAMVALRTGKDVNDVVMGVFHPNKNSHIWILINSHPEFEEKGTHPVRVFSTFIDITEKRKSEEELKQINSVLRESQENLENLLHSQTNYVLRTDLLGHQTYWNNKFEEDFGWIYADTGLKQASSMSSVCSYHHERVFRAVQECIQNPGKIVKVEIDKPTRDGGICTTLWEFLCLTDENEKPFEMQCMGIDITDKKAAEENLLKSEEKYRSLFDDSPLAYAIFQDGAFKEVNNAFASLLEMEREEIFQLGVEGISKKEQLGGSNILELAEQHIQKTIENGKNKFDWSFQRPNGTSFCGEVKLAVTTYGENTAIIVHVEDVTNIRTNQREIQKLTHIIEQSPNSIFLTDLEGNIQYSNKQSSRSSGYSKSELYGHNPRIWKSEKTDPALYDALWKSLTAGEKWSGTFTNRKKDGTLFSEYSTAFPIKDEEGKIINYAAIQEDVTQKIQSELELLQFRTITDQANLGSAVANLEGVLTYCNKVFAESHGYTVEELIGKNLGMLHSEREMPKVMGLIRMIAENGGFAAEEVYHMRKDGSEFPTIMSGKLITNQDGVPICMSATLVDISDRKEMEDQLKELNQNLEGKVLERTRELNEAKELAESASRSKSEFLSRMSHELRTPLNSIIGFSQLLQMEDLTPKQEKNVGFILKSGSHLLNMINEILDISRIEIGHMSISLESVEIVPLIREVKQMLRPLTEKRNITLQIFSQLSNENPFIIADRERIKQVFTNLLNNAIKYNHNDGMVSVVMKNGDKKNTIRIEVTDNGRGITQEDLTKIFDPFQRIGAENTEIEGTGLGLAVVKQLVNLMKGSLGVHSEPGKGSTFWVEFEEGHDLTTPKAEDAHKQSDQMDLEGVGTVIYIEDNPANVDLVQQVFDVMIPNAKLVHGKLGSDAMPLAIKYSPKLILLDLNLPDMHGSDVLMQLREESFTKDIPVIVVSADATTKQIENLMELGAKDYLTKPLQIKEFVTKVKAIIQ
jgi:PAS domain S-box-containing protein